MFAVAVTAVAVVADARLAHYFTYVIQKCSYDDGKVHCFCEETKSDFSEVFHNAGDIRCNNPFTKNTDFLLANFILSIGCLVLSSLLLLCFLVWCVGGLCSSTCCNVHVYPDSDSSYPARSPAFPNNGSYQRIPLTSSRGAELL